MSYAFRVFLAAAVASLVMVTGASARSKFPLVQCGPGNAYLCKLHGYYTDPPFHYDLAIYPGCLKRERVQTPHGVRYMDVLVCGTNAPSYTFVY